MATANSLAAINAGAVAVDVTVAGLGERAGNAALEQVVMAVEHCLHRGTGISGQHLCPLADLVMAAAKRRVDPAAPLIGSGLFAMNPVFMSPYCPATPWPTRLFRPLSWDAKRACRWWGVIVAFLLYDKQCRVHWPSTYPMMPCQLYCSELPLQLSGPFNYYYRVGAVSEPPDSVPTYA